MSNTRFFITCLGATLGAIYAASRWALHHTQPKSPKNMNGAPNAQMVHYGGENMFTRREWIR